MILLPFYPVEFLLTYLTQNQFIPILIMMTIIIEDIIKDHMASCVQDIGEYFRILRLICQRMVLAIIMIILLGLN